MIYRFMAEVSGLEKPVGKEKLETWKYQGDFHIFVGQ
jgi:hypothetical protein